MRCASLCSCADCSQRVKAVPRLRCRSPMSLCFSMHPCFADTDQILNASAHRAASRRSRRRWTKHQLRRFAPHKRFHAIRAKYAAFTEFSLRLTASRYPTAAHHAANPKQRSNPACLFAKILHARMLMVSTRSRASMCIVCSFFSHSDETFSKSARS